MILALACCAVAAWLMLWYVFVRGIFGIMMMALQWGAFGGLLYSLYWLFTHRAV